MPSILPHVLLPVLLAIAFLPVARRRILLWAPMALVPDLDFFFARAFHRALLSNIWVPLILAAVMVFLWRRRAPTARFGEWMWRPGTPGNLAITIYYLTGHLFMDIFAGGVSLLWPLTTTNFYLFFQIVVNTATNQPVVDGGGGTEPDIVTPSPVYEWWSTIDSAMLALTLLVLIIWAGVRWWNARHHPGPIVVRRAATVARPSHKQ